MDTKRYFGIQWHVTNRCDQRCKHCYIYQGPESDQSYDQEINLSESFSVIKKFQKFCKAMDCHPSFTITGGDPLLRPQIWDLLEMIHREKIPFSILGNPFHLNHEVGKRLRSLGCRDYQMSIDGLEETHDFLRKPGSFKATLEAFDFLKSSGIETVVMSTVSNLNYKEMPGLVKLLVDLGVDSYAFARYCPTDSDLEYNIQPLEYKQFLSEMWDVYTELANKGTDFPLKDHLWKLFLYEKGLFKPRKHKIVYEGCNCAIRHMTILADGTIYACRRFESPVGNIRDQSFEDIFLGPELSKYREIEKMEGCKDCELLYHCRGCRAVSYGVSKDFFARDPQCWRFE